MTPDMSFTMVEKIVPSGINFIVFESYFSNEICDSLPRYLISMNFTGNRHGNYKCYKIKKVSLIARATMMIKNALE